MSEESLVDGAAFALVEGVPFYDRYTEASFRGVLFHGKTVEEWLDEVQIPEIPTGVSFVELEEFNSQYMVITETIMRNHSISRVGLDYALLHYKKALGVEIARLTGLYVRDNKRVPSRESLENTAKINIIDIYTAYKIASMFFNLWESQFEKVKLASYRLSAMNHIKSMER